MVDVSGKSPSVRKAMAQCSVTMNSEAFVALRDRTLDKGDAIKMAEVAGIMAAKQTPALIPLCHQIALDYATVKLTLVPELCKVLIHCESQVTDKTGCEMEALTGATVAALTVYDMCKSIDKQMVIGECMLVRKTGGKSGDVFNKV